MIRARHQARIVALQGLYQLDMQRATLDADIDESLTPLLAEAGLSGEATGYARDLTAGTWAGHQRYDEMIAGVSAHWDVSRMAVVDRNILRLAIHELIERPDVPARVIIDEAIELGREFGDAETPHFMNGVLDALYKNHPACRIARGDQPPGHEVEK
jgi:transcription antitermination protein NusB